MASFKINRSSRWLALVASALVVNLPHVRGETIISIEDTPIVQDLVPFGINTSTPDGFWDVQGRYVRMEENFEGLFQRRMYTLNADTEDATAVTRIGGGHREVWNNAEAIRYTVVSGPSKWEQGLVESIDYSGNTATITLDRELELKKGNGLMLAGADLSKGAFERKSGRIEGDTEFVVGHSAPGTFGHVSLKLKSDAKESLLRCILGTQHRTNSNGDWVVRFLARGASSEASVAVEPSHGEEVSVPLTSEWQAFERTIKVAGAPVWPEDLTYVNIELKAQGADVLIDEVYIARVGENHPSHYRREMLDVYEDLGVGILRILQGDDNTLVNTINPRMESFNSFGSLHRLYEACEELNAEPYFCLPATMDLDEMSFFLEYLGGPVTTPGGSLRAKLGQKEPWLEVLPGVVLEIGNELYNFGGYGGPDYWHDLIAQCKSSPYYDPEKIFFVTGHQGSGLDYARNSDGHAINAYICWGFSKEDYEKYLSDDEKLYRWAVAYAQEALHRPDGMMQRTYHEAKELGIEMAMYEGNYHTNFGTGPSDPRNRLVTSVGGQVNFVNLMLGMLKHLEMRRQCYFKDIGYGLSFSGHTAFGSGEAGFVRIWGSILNIDDGHLRYRPGALALKLVNKAMMGDLVTTQHSGSAPSFSFTGTFPWRVRDLRGNSRVEEETVANVSEIYSYAFKNKNERSVILVNLSPTEAHPVVLNIPAQAAGQGAKAWILQGDNFFDNNEPEHEVSVTLTEKDVANFKSGSRFELPPASMMALIWKEQ